MKNVCSKDVTKICRTSCSVEVKVVNETNNKTSPEKFSYVQVVYTALCLTAENLKFH